MKVMHRLHCQEPWFSYLKSGEKTVEGRKYSEKIRIMKPGESMQFFNDDKSFIVTIAAIRVYSSLRSYLEGEGVSCALPGIQSIEEAQAIYQQWSTPNEIEQLGFAAIEVALK